MKFRKLEFLQTLGQERRLVSVNLSGMKRKVTMLIAASATIAALGTAVVMADPKEERTLKVTATAFNSTVAQTDDRPYETACGDELTPKSRIIAVSRDLKSQGLDCGTKVRIAGLGSFTVADVTAKRHTQLIDIYMGDDIKRARKWGRQQVEITVAER